MLWIFLCLIVGQAVQAFPEQGKFVLTLNSTNTFNGVAKNVYKGTKLYLKIHCNSADSQTVKIGWILRETVVRTF